MNILHISYKMGGASYRYSIWRYEDDSPVELLEENILPSELWHTKNKYGIKYDSGGMKQLLEL